MTYSVEFQMFSKDAANKNWDLSVLRHNTLKIKVVENKLSNEKNLPLKKKERPAEAVLTYPCLYDENKKEYKDKNVCRNPRGKVNEVLEFIENWTWFLVQQRLPIGSSFFLY